MCRIRSYVGVFLFIKLGGEVALKLNARQKAFCEFYVASGNATEAAIKAGYSKRTARSIGQENLTKPALNNYIILNQNILKNYNRHQLAK